MNFALDHSFDNRAASYVKMTNVKMTYRFSGRVAKVSS